jgi:hypothetical protein
MPILHKPLAFGHVTDIFDMGASPSKFKNFSSALCDSVVNVNNLALLLRNLFRSGYDPLIPELRIIVVDLVVTEKGNPFSLRPALFNLLRIH